MPGTMKLCTSKSTVTAKACSVARLARHNVVCRASSGSCTSNGVVAQSSGSAQQAVVSAMLAANLFMSNVAFAADAIEVSAEVRHCASSASVFSLRGSSPRPLDSQCY